MKPLLITLALAISIIGTSCDVIEGPYEKNPIVPVDTTLRDTSSTVVSTGGLQHVLLEDYTGHTCGNCPEAADVAAKIYADNNGRVIVTAIHAGGFAVVEPPDFVRDLTCPAGVALDQAFRISRAGNPNGLVNRVTLNNRIIQGMKNWEPAVAQLLPLQPVVDLALSHTYYPERRTVIVTVRATALQNIDASTNISVWLQENGIIGDQKDYRRTPSHIEDYEFEHVLRTSFNGTWGDTLNPTPVPKGTVITRTVRYEIPAEKLNTADTLNVWTLKNCELVAFAHKASTTREVLQVVKQKFVP
ncbi:MAG: Omp28-related outer membrane protein [Candidatus Kapabacteria bacterium]|nr:Omp28-related outer membrane protein [Candidatus Kapabacteria bacterium]